MARLSANEEKEMMRGIELVLREMLVPHLEAIKKQVDALSAIMDRVEANREGYRSRHRAA